MTHSLNWEAIPTELRAAYEMVGTQLIQVEELLQHKLKHNNPFVDELLFYSFQLGGKRMRPLLVLLMGQICGSIEADHLRAAVALELIHTGSLVHDDILDGASFRRHFQTIHEKWDAKAAVLVGDLLLTRAMETITESENLNAWREISVACRKTCEGELLQMANRYRYEMDENEYMEIIGGKTAALLECCCSLGADFAQATPNQQASAKKLGYSLGIAFQIVDDLLDLVGDAGKTGKTLGTDLENGKPTLPIILYLNNATPSEKEEMINLLKKVSSTTQDKSATAEIVQRLEQSHCIESAARQANKIVDDAMEQLKDSITNNLSPTSVQQATLEALHQVATFVIHRNR